MSAYAVSARGLVSRRVPQGVLAPMNELLFGSGEQGAWLDANDLSTLFQDLAGTVPGVVGEPVGKWLDKSGRGNHAVAPTNAARPTLGQGANGEYYLVFDGVSMGLRIANLNLGGVDKATQVTGHVQDGNSGTVVVLTELGANANLGGFAHLPYAFGSEQVAVGGAATVFAGTNVPLSPGAKGVVSILLDKSLPSGAAKIRVNCGVFSETGAATIGGVFATAHFNIGGRNLAGNFFQGKLSSIIVRAGQLSAAELLRAENYSIAAQKLPYRGTNLIGVGDSHTYNISYGQTMDDFYPARLDGMMRPGWRKSSVNYGVSGDTTAKIIARLVNVKSTDTGNVAILYAGTNDANYETTVQASPPPTTTTFSVASNYGAAYKAGGYVVVNGVSALVLSVVGDAFTLAAPLSSAPAAGATVKSDIRTNLVLIGNALKARGYTKLIVAGQHYLNFATGGDTVTTPLAAQVALRAQQAGAAQDLGAVYVDFHAYMRALIVTGAFTQGDALWHVAASNTHLNNVGEQVLADALYAAMQAQGWA